MSGTFDKPEIVQEDLDILLIGGGMACCGTAYEMMRWAEAVKAETGTELKIKMVDKAAMDRPGAVAQGLSAINTYTGPGRWEAQRWCESLLRAHVSVDVVWGTTPLAGYETVVVPHLKLVDDALAKRLLAFVARVRDLIADRGLMLALRCIAFGLVEFTSGTQ